MKELLAKIERFAPQWFLALVVIVATVLFLFYYNPPHTLCDTQKQVYIKSQQMFLGYDPNLKGYSYYDVFFERCLKTNNRGGCEPYFSGFKKALNDLSILDSQCIKPVVNLGRIKGAMTSLLVQVTRLAWGDQGPQTVHGRNAWLTASHLKLFCRVKSHYQVYYGKNAYEALVKSTLKSLPNERKLTELQKRDRSLFSVPCSQFF